MPYIERNISKGLAKKHCLSLVGGLTLTFSGFAVRTIRFSSLLSPSLNFPLSLSGTQSDIINIFFVLAALSLVFETAYLRITLEITAFAFSELLPRYSLSFSSRLLSSSASCAFSSLTLFIASRGVPKALSETLILSKLSEAKILSTSSWQLWGVRYIP